MTAWRTVNHDRTYRPSELQWELGLGKTQFSLWANALGMIQPGKRKHFYDATERIELLRFRSLLNQYGSLSTAFEQWLNAPREAA